MSKTKPSLFESAAAWPLLAACLLFTANVRAQDLPSRFLLIFDTSSDMKDRVKAEQFEVDQLLATSMGGHLQAEDSLGIWTFDKSLRTGEFPLATWAPENAQGIATAIDKYIRKQHYSGSTTFAVLQPALDEVITNSPRLTILIFCDGADNINWTPYNGGINQIFGEHNAAQKKAKQPYVLVLRTQLGQYTGCTVNFPPGMLNFPDFPPFPLPPQPKPVMTAPPAPAPPPSTLKPLIIVGTNVMDEEPPSALAPVNSPPPPPAKPPHREVTVTNTITMTNVVVATNVVVTTNLVVATNLVAATKAIVAPAVATPPEPSHFNRKGAFALGAGFVIAAVGLIGLAVSRNRNVNRASLITRSMRKD